MSLIIPAKGYWAKATGGTYVQDWNGRRNCMVPEIVRRKKEFMLWHSMLAAKQGAMPARITMFALVERDALGEVQEAARAASPSLLIEADMKVFQGFSFAVFGNAHTSDEWMIEKEAQEGKIVAMKTEIKPVGMEALVARANENGYTLDMPSSFVQSETGQRFCNSTDVNDLLLLFEEAFGEKGLREWRIVLDDLALPEHGQHSYFHMFAARDAQGRMASFAMADHLHEIGMQNGESVPVFYFADGATFRNAQGKGLLASLISGRMGFFGKMAGRSIMYSEVITGADGAAKASFRAGMEYAGCVPNYNMEEGKPPVSVNVFYVQGK